MSLLRVWTGAGRHNFTVACFLLPTFMAEVSHRIPNLTQRHNDSHKHKLPRLWLFLVSAPLSVNILSPALSPFLELVPAGDKIGKGYIPRRFSSISYKCPNV